MNIAIIPARGGSKRIPKKNLEKIGNNSLVEWAIYTAKFCQLQSMIDEIFVSSDDQDILLKAMEYNVIDWKRNPKAATDDATDRDVILDIIDNVKSHIDLIAYLRPTTPFRKSIDVENAVKSMERIPNASGLRSIHEMSESAYKCFQLKPGRILEPLPLKWSHVFSDVDGANLPNKYYPVTYHPNGVVDIMRPGIIKDGGTFGNRVMGYITNPTIEIDNKNDLELARYQFAIKYQGKMEAFTNA